MAAEDDKIQIFTGAQRKYLDGEKPDITDDYERNLRGRIRERVTASLQDIQRFKNVEKKDRQQIFNANINQTPTGTITDDGWPDMESFVREGTTGLSFAFLSFFEFYYRTMRENGYSLNDQQKELQYALEKSEQLVQNELEEGRYDVSATVEVNEVKKINTEDALEDAKNRFQEDGLDGVSSEELKALAEADYITLHGNWE